MKRLLILLLCSSALLAQVESRKTYVAFDLPKFFVDVLGFSSGDSLTTRVDIYLQVPYDDIQFVKKNDRYTGSYEVTVNFLTDDNASVAEKIWTEEVRVPVFEYTESKKTASLTRRSIDMQPGIYTIRVQVKDLESKKVSYVVKKILVGNYFRKELALSDVMLVNRSAAEGERRAITPNISGDIGERNNSFSIFFEVYTDGSIDSLLLHYTITDSKGKEFLNTVQRFNVNGTKDQVITRFDSAKYAPGAYVLTVDARSTLAEPGSLPIVKKRMFVVRSGNMPVSISDVSLAVKQMRYIAKADEYDQIDETEDPDEKRRLFDAFWKKRDPSPGTDLNEYMEEYYSRVEYANKHFSHYQQGWRTDMGMVFILFGSPNNVERHPFDIDSKPYEVWTYFEYNRSIVFVDESGFGDYRLLTPIWDLLQRLKTN
ncbi:MAG: GWxTD domain-containing protein [Bacteroidetes bacterium]|nr:GWxTD domain-containing protein [Bacteroidota bacterium]